jgi:indole-3-glycerol phosphate synthase
VNARDLETLAMDPGAHERLIPRIPRELIAIAESGLAGRADVERVAGYGADAVLMGTSLAKADDMAGAVAACVGVPRVGR